MASGRWRLGDTTWAALSERDVPPVLVVPVGSCEQHGPHLPLATDSIVAEALAAGLVETLDPDATRFLIAPTIAVSASGEHQGFAGTLSLGTHETAAVLIELVRSADWADGVVFVNGHGGNLAAVSEAVGVLAAEQRNVLTWWPNAEGGDLHAGHTETSMLLALAPDLVHARLAVSGPEPALGDLVTHGVHALSPSGVLGDPTGATAEHGHELLRQLTADLVATVERWLDARAAP